MMRPAVSGALAALALAGPFAGTSVAAGRTPTPDAHIVGEVRVCNIPGRCLTRIFDVSAIDSAGHLRSHLITSGPDNSFRLLVPPGHYSLIATSHGLRCAGATSAKANRTVTANITCLVP